jgi:hypothetical protein
MLTIEAEAVCAACPFWHLVYHMGRDLWMCEALDRMIPIALDPWEESPTWCPLREGPVTVRLKGGDDAND